MTRSPLWNPTTHATSWDKMAKEGSGSVHRGQTPLTPRHRTHGRRRRPFCPMVVTGSLSELRPGTVDPQVPLSSAGVRPRGPELGQPSLTGRWWRLSAVAACTAAPCGGAGWDWAPGSTGVAGGSTAPALKDVCGRAGGGDGPPTAHQAHVAPGRWQLEKPLAARQRFEPGPPGGRGRFHGSRGYAAGKMGSPETGRVTKATSTLGDTGRLVAELARLGLRPPGAGQAGQRAIVLGAASCMAASHRPPQGLHTQGLRPGLRLWGSPSH